MHVIHVCIWHQIPHIHWNQGTNQRLSATLDTFQPLRVLNVFDAGKIFYFKYVSVFRHLIVTNTLFYSQIFEADIDRHLPFWQKWNSQKSKSTYKTETNCPPFYKRHFQMRFIEPECLNFPLKFHWGLFLNVQLTMTQQWFMWWLASDQGGVSKTIMSS